MLRCFKKHSTGMYASTPTSAKHSPREHTQLLNFILKSGELNFLFCKGFKRKQINSINIKAWQPHQGVSTLTNHVEQNMGSKKNGISLTVQQCHRWSWGEYLIVQLHTLPKSKRTIQLLLCKYWKVWAICMLMWHFCIICTSLKARIPAFT